MHRTSKQLRARHEGEGKGEGGWAAAPMILVLALVAAGVCIGMPQSRARYEGEGEGGWAAAPMVLVLALVAVRHLFLETHRIDAGTHLHCQVSSEQTMLLKELPHRQPVIALWFLGASIQLLLSKVYILVGEENIKRGEAEAALHTMKSTRQHTN
ncbi:hypothetical protein BJV74DRAFT_800057 [Russula compacta]|nr:hypothetical protein BJV74DRAFT_800057 [Russula compacta]